MRGSQIILSLFRNDFDKLNYTGARMLDECGKIKPTPCMFSPFSHLSIDVSTAHVDTISLVKFTFAQTLLIGG